MRGLKIFLLSLTGVLLILMVVLVVVVATFDDSDYRRVLIRTVDVFTDYRLTVTGTFHIDLSSTPALSAAEIKLDSKTGGNEVRIGNFEFQFALRPLLSGTLLIKRLVVEKMIVDLKEHQDDGGGVDLSGWIRVSALETVMLKDIAWVFNDDGSKFTLTQLAIDESDDQGPLFIQGEGDIRGVAFGVDGTLGPVAQVYDAINPYPFNIRIQLEQAMLSISGTVENLAQGKGLDVSLDVNVPDVSNLPGQPLPISGQLTGAGRLHGNINAPRLSDLQMNLSRGESLLVVAMGSVGNLLTRKDTEIRLSGFVKDPKVLGLLFSGDMPAFDEVKFRMTLSKSKEDFELDDVIIHLSDPLGLKVEFKGNGRIGDVDAQQPFSALDIQVHFSSTTTEAAKFFLVDILPEMGPVEGTAKITAPGEELAVEDIAILIGTKRTVQLIATGRIGRMPIDPDAPNREISLDLSLKAEHAPELGSLFDLSLPGIGPVSIDARFVGSSRTATVDDIKVVAGNPKVLSVQADGNLRIDRFYTGHPLRDTDFDIRVSAPSIRPAFRWLDTTVPDLGPLKASMRLQGEGEQLTGKDIHLRIGNQGSLLLTAEGSISRIPISAKPVRGINLSWSVQAESTRVLSKLVGNPNIPDLGPLNARFTIKGSSEVLEIADISARTGNLEGLEMSASGVVQRIPLKGSEGFQGVRIEVAATAPRTSVLSPLVGFEVPDIGELRANARLEDYRGKLGIQQLDITTGERDKPFVKVSGSIKDLIAGEQLDLTVRFDENLISQLLPHPVSEVGQLNGKINLSDADGSLGIDALKIETVESKLFGIKIRGELDDLLEGDEIDFYADISMQDLAIAGKLFGADLPELGPIQASGHLHGDNEKAGFKGKIVIGNTELDSDLSVSYIDKFPVIWGKVFTPILYLEDFGIKADADSIAASRSSEASTDPNAPLFSQSALPLDTLKKVDLDLTVEINEIVGSEYTIDRMDTKLLQKQGILRVKALNFVFSGGQVVMDAEVDARTDPRMAVHISGDDLNLRELLHQVHKPAAIEGDLHLLVDLKSKGRSPHDIASNLSGEVGLVLENGRIRRRELDLLFLDLVGWLFTYGISKNETDISCAITRYKIENGIVDTKLFYIDGPKLTARGKGHIDLSSETIDMVINAEKKRLFFNSRTPIRIRGDLADPTITAIPLSQGILLAGGYIFAPYVLIPETALGALWSLVNEGSPMETPCLEQVEPPG